MRFFGYARASTSQQSLGDQIELLEAAGVETGRIFTDSVPGNHGAREGLRQLQAEARHGDVVLVTRLDRLGRNLADLIQVIRTFEATGVTLRFLHDGISTEGAMGTMMVAVLVAVAQAERQRIQERTNEGRIEAREKGVRFGRKPSVDRDRVQALRMQGLGAADIARQMNIGRSTVYKILHAGLEKEPVK